jgi:hypothetical protein
LRFSDPQYGHFIMTTIVRFTALSVFLIKVDTKHRVSLFKPFSQ